MSLDIITLLSKGDKRTVNNVGKVVQYSLKNKHCVNILVDCMKSSDEGLAMRASDALEKVFSRKPEYFQDQSASLVEILTSNPQKEVRWHIAQILPKLPLTTYQLNKVADIWINDFYNSKSSIVKTFSLQAMHDVVINNANLQPRYQEMLEYALNSGTPAMTSRAKKLARRSPTEP